MCFQYLKIGFNYERYERYISLLSMSLTISSYTVIEIALIGQRNETVFDKLELGIVSCDISLIIVPVWLCK